MLASAKDMPPLDRENYGNLVHWHPVTYRQLRKGGPKTEDATEDGLPALEVEASSSGAKLKSEKEGPILSCFLEDKNGDPVSDTEKKAISSIAGAFWWYLLENEKAPETFRRANLGVKLQWRMLMESNFECFRYCDNHWKVEQYWSNNYTSWMKNALKHLEAKKLKAKAAKAKNNSAIMVDDDDENNDNSKEDIDEAIGSKNNKRGPPDSDKTSKSKRARVEEPKAPPPPPQNVTTKRARVRTLCFSTICLTNNV
jgi:hypothetical protein